MPGCQDRVHNIDSLGSEERFLFLSVQFLYVIERKFIITGDTMSCFAKKSIDKGRAFAEPRFVRGFDVLG